MKSKKKIGIITIHSDLNYGAALQAYALNQYLRNQGYDSEIINYIKIPNHPRQYPFPKNIAYWLMNRPRFLRYRKFLKSSVTAKEWHSVEELMNGFNEPFDVLISGSDQVWNPTCGGLVDKLNPCYYLAFAQSGQYKKVAYASSLGSYRFNAEERVHVKEWLDDYHHLSTRESSGAEHLKGILGKEVKVVLDPTLLLDKSDYEKIVEREEEPACGGSLFCYVLDSEPAKSRALEVLASRTGLSPFMSMPRKPATAENLLTDPEACVYPPVTRWLRSFMDARLVLTDSFHGCVFSILFNKPFWVIGNRARGMARFESLLGMFGLGERLVTPEQLEAVDPLSPVDWASVNARREEMRAFSMSFLTNSLQ